jgi:AraC-like DNA-binding protein
MEGHLTLVRATHLNVYISVLRDIGAPVDRDLARSKLPENIETTPDLYVSIPVALEWIARTGHDLRPMELGLLGAQNTCLSSLRPAQQAAIMTAQTGLTRLEALAALSRFEDSALAMRIQREADDVRVICEMAGVGRHPFICLAEWLNLQAVISVVRSVAGPSWRPRELCFVSSARPPATVQATFPETRLRMGQAHTSIVVGGTDLARSTNDATAPAHDAAMEGDGPDGPAAAWEFVSLLRMMVQPYIGGGSPDVAFAAEMAGMSTRTLQRRLKLCGSSYSQILQEARFSLACERLDDPGLKVIEVAMLAGYETPQHFTRAFRRFTGVTPSEYRDRCVEQA